jgi:hypothetical protein
MKQVLIWIIELRVMLACHSKWKKIFKYNSNHAVQLIDWEKRYLEFWRKRSKSTQVNQAALLASISGKDDVKFVSEQLYYTQIESTLNQRLFAMAYADKNFYEHYIHEVAGVFPVSFIRCVNGQLLDQHYREVGGSYCWNQLPSELILKPSIDTSGGENVFLVRRVEDGAWHLEGKSYSSLALLLKHWMTKHKHFVLQERLMQHPWFAKWNTSSLNTVRLMVYRSVKNNEVHTLGAVLRFGKPGSLVDNQAAGGLTCGIDADGKAGTYVCNKYGKVKGCIDQFSALLGSEVPAYPSMQLIAKKIAKQYPYHRLLGFDFAVDKDGNVKLLEINCKNIEINFIQMNVGPLFGEFTEEVLHYTSAHKRQVVLEIRK